MEEISYGRNNLSQRRKPYPNNPLPVLFFENVLAGGLEEEYNGDDVLQLFTNNGYMNGWKTE